MAVLVWRGTDRHGRFGAAVGERFGKVGIARHDMFWLGGLGQARQGYVGFGAARRSWIGSIWRGMVRPVKAVLAKGVML